MKNYLLLGYNSGGYKDSVEICFDGTIERLDRPDPKYPDTPSATTYFHITYADGSVVDEDNKFMEKLILEKRGYHESFLVCQIFEINEESFFKALKQKDIDSALKLLEFGIDANAKDKDGQTALHIIARDDDFFGFGHVLEMGADINIKNLTGETPLDIHIKYKNDRHFIDYLMKKGALRGDESL